jgi:hypothetical protein
VSRTQLYLDDDLWIRQAVRERYLEKAAERHKAMTDFIGLWKDRTDLSSRGLAWGARSRE